MLGFLFGGNTGQTPESLQQRREAIEQMIKGQEQPKNWGQGLGALMGGLASGVERYRINRDEAAGRETDSAAYNALLGRYGDGASSSGFGSSPPDGDVPMAGGPAVTTSGGEVFSGFMDTVKQGGVKNPYALAAIASTGKAESGWSPERANRRWSDPSESGQAGTSGGIMSWRNDRLANLENFAKAAGEDPSNISAATQAKFFLQENPDLIAQMNNASSVEEAQSLMNNAWKFAGYDKPSREAANRLSSANAYLSQFQGGQQDNAAMPDTATAYAPQDHGGNSDPANYLSYKNSGATRNQPLSKNLASSLGFLSDMGIKAAVFSGGQPSAEEGGARTGSTRHDHGDAADVFFYKDGRKLDWNNPDDQPIFQEIVRRGKAAGITGFGAGDGYMQPGSMHIGFGKPGVWGAGGKGANAAGWLASAYNDAGNQGGTGPQTSLDAVNAMATGGQQPQQNTALAYQGQGQQVIPMAGQDQSALIPQQFQGSQQLMNAKGGMMPALMSGNQPQTQQVSQVQQVQQQSMSGPSMQELYQLLARPFLSNEQRAVVGQLIEQRQQEQQFARKDQQWRAQEDYKYQQQQNDPAHQAELEFKRAQIDKAKREAANPNGDENFFGNPVAIKNKDGSISYGQIGNKGSFRPIQLGDGQSFAPPAKTVDTGTEIIQLDQAGNEVSRTSKQIFQEASQKAEGAVAGKAKAETQNEYNSITSKMPGLRTVVDELEDLSNKATYTWAGKGLDAARNQLGMDPREEAVARAEYIAKVNNVVLPLLKDTFGAAFTNAEGERLALTLGDPDKSPAEKTALVRAFIAQKERDIAALKSRVGQNGGDAAGVIAKEGNAAASNDARNSDVLSQARAAIANGRDRDAIIKRVKEMGIDPEGL